MKDNSKSALLTMVIIAAAVAIPVASASDDAVKFGFESGDLAGWTIVSGEFGKIVTDRATFHTDGQPYNHEGKWHLSTLDSLKSKNDAYMGELRSAPFKLSAPGVSFLVGGGSKDVYVALCTADGKEVKRATGNNAEKMERIVWGLPELVGQDVFLKIVDGNKAGWGHITFDDFRMGVNEIPATVTEEAIIDNGQRVWGKKLDADWVESLTERGHPLDVGIAGSKSEDSLKYIGMPVGGIGCGTVYLGGDGQLWVWDIFNQFHEGVVSQNVPLTPELEALLGRSHNLTERQGANYVSPPTPQTFPNEFEQGFGVKIDKKFRRFDAKDWANVKFEGDWPMGTVHYRDPDAPVEVTLHAYSPFIPLNVKDSSLPTTIMEFTVRNTSKKSVAADVSGWLENAASIHTRKVMPVELVTRRTESEGMKLLTHSSSATKEGIRQAGMAKRPDVVFEEFEGADYGQWMVDGDAFGPGPLSKDAVPNYVKIQGQGAASSKKDGEGRAVGTLTSPTFVIERKTIQFCMAGGKIKPETLCLNLLVDGKVVASEAGPGGNSLVPMSMNVSLLQGKTAQLQIVDAESGAGWAFVQVDQIVFADGQDDEAVITQALDYGTMSLGVLRADAKAVDHEGVPGWVDGLKLAPGESKTVTFLLSWNFPSIYKIPTLPEKKHEYSSRFADSAAVAEYVAGNYPRLRDETRAWVRSWYDSTLPTWFLDRTLLTADTLQTANVYLFENGDFWGWEGIGSCAGTCTHVYQYAQAFARLFPSLERNVREVWNYGRQYKDGGLGHRGLSLVATDGQAGVVLSTYREHLMSADDEFLRRVWPQTKRAIEMLIRDDANDDGIIEVEQHNTLDAAWSGPVAWISGEYQAALRATEEMALVMGDEVFAQKVRGIYKRGGKYIVENLYNGEYFFNIPDPDKPVKGNSVTGCLIDQVFGQSWAFQVGLGRTLPAEEVRSALNSIWKYNFVEDVGAFRSVNRAGRWYALPGESGVVMCTSPRDEKPRQGAYLAENMTGFEYQVAGHMLYEGTPELIGKGMAITRAIHDRYSASKRNPYNEIECSDHYARAAASYGAFLGACGFDYNGPKGELSFTPRLTPEDFRAGFTAAEGWGSFAQKVIKGRQSAEIDLRYGTLSLKKLSFGQSKGTQASGVSVKIDGKYINAKFTVEDGYYVVSFDTAVRLKAGQRLEISFI